MPTNTYTRTCSCLAIKKKSPFVKNDIVANTGGSNTAGDDPRNKQNTENDQQWHLQKNKRSCRARQRQQRTLVATRVDERRCRVGDKNMRMVFKEGRALINKKQRVGGKGNDKL